MANAGLWLLQTFQERHPAGWRPNATSPQSSWGLQQVIAALHLANTAFPIFLSMGAQCPGLTAEWWQEAEIPCAWEAMTWHTSASAAGARLRRREQNSTSAPAHSGQFVLSGTKWNHEQTTFYDGLWLLTPLTGRLQTYCHSKRNYNGSFIWELCPRGGNVCILLAVHQVHSLHATVHDTEGMWSANLIVCHCDCPS